MKRILTFVTSLAMIFGFAFGPMPAFAATNSEELCVGSGGTWKKDENAPSGGICTSPDGRTVGGTIQQIVDVLIFLIGAIAVLMIIIGGIRYVVSGGDQAALTSAKK